MIRRVCFLLNTIIFFSATLNGQKDRNLFISPLKIPLSLSANFGEIRADHFHSGIDIKTQGVTGKEVVASDDGYVYLLLVSPGGFGRAIFIRHQSGYSTVYGHLDSYAPEIEEYVKARQYEYKSFPVTIYPPKEKFLILKGQTIGFSGNSGSSSGPHLHYEIRKSDGEKRVNPLLFNLGIEDNIKPVIERLVIYPGSDNATVNGRSEKLYLNLIGSEGSYSLPGDIELNIRGPAGFGITSYDYINNTAGRFGNNSIELQIDSLSLFLFELKEFSFSETRFVNAHIDYEAYMKNNLEIERAFTLPNDKLSLYKRLINNGLINFNDNKNHSVKIIVKDGSDNKSVLSFIVKPALPYSNLKVEKQDSNIRIMPFGKNNIFTRDGIKVNIPSGSLYDTLYFSYSKSDGNGNLFSDIHHIHNRYTPLQKSINLAIRPDSIPTGKASKLLIVQIDENKKMVAVGGTYTGGLINSDILSFGNFAVSIDTIPPVIMVNGLINGANLTGRKDIRIKITDNLSGIKSYTGYLDDKWILFEYDSKFDLLVYKFDPSRITKGTKHKLQLRVTDNRENSSVYNCEFIW